MKIIIDNCAYKHNPLVKTYGTDFLCKENSFQKNQIESDTTEGTFEDFKLNGVSIWIKDFANSDIFEERISNNFSMFKLHFSIKGSYHFSSVNNRKGIEVPQGYCNLFYFQKIKGLQKMTGERTATVEVLFTEMYLKSLLGESYEQVVEHLRDLSSDKNAHCLWETSKRIPPNLTSFVMGVMQCHYSGRAKESCVKAKIDCILLDFFLGKHPYFATDQKTLPNTNYEAMLRVEAYMKQNLKKRLTIDHLSSLAGLNTTKLKHDFKKVFSTTIFKHITKLRMEEAKKLIVDSDFSVAQASYEVGYTNPQHFTVAFKKSMGYLPSKLKDQVENKR